MAFELDLNKIKQDIYVLLIYLIVALTGGFMFMFIYFRHFFLNTDNYRLTLMSLGISMPLVFLNFFLVAFSVDYPTEKDNLLPVSDYLGIGSLLTLPGLYVPILIGFFLSSPSKYFGVSIVLCFELLVVTLCIIIRRARNKRGKVELVNE